MTQNFEQLLAARLETLADLPTLPTVAQAVIRSVGSTATSAADVGHMIERDVALAGKVLKLVNSAYYGFPRQIKSIQHAVVILGFNKVKNVVLTVAVFDLARRREGSRLDVRRLWQHSLGAGLAAKAVAETILGGVGAEEAYMGGLLHDVGKVVMDILFPHEYTQVLERVAREKRLLVETEREVLGMTAHTRVGTYLAERWRLPTALRDAIAHHHHPSRAAANRALANAVHLGDILARALEVGDGGDARIPALDPSVIQHHNLGPSEIERIMDAFLAELSRAQEFFSLLESGARKTA